MENKRDFPHRIMEELKMIFLEMSSAKRNIEQKGGLLQRFPKCDTFHHITFASGKERIQ